jgi:4-carboxymuconolactone decarboxylase
MTRIPYRDIETLPDEPRRLTLERGNLNVYRTLANAENVFTGWMVAGREHLTSPTISVRLRELVILRTGYLMDSSYEVAQHTAVAKQAGVSGPEIAALAPDGDLDAPGFDATELAILRLITELITTRQVAVELFDRVHDALGDEATIEVLMLVHRWAGLALMLNALDVDLDTDARLTTLPMRVIE